MTRRSPFFAALLTSSMLCAAPADAAVLLNRVVFEAGTHGYSYYRIPAIVRANNGDSLAFAEGRVSSASDRGNIDIVMSRSTDEGRT